MSKTYSNRGNAGRAARVALGNHKAVIGTDFVVEGGHKAFTFRLLTAAAPVAHEAPKHDAPAHEPKAAKPKKAKRVKGDAKIEDQPQMRRIVEMCSRKTGATIEDIATRFECEQHTVRGAISRLRNEAKITFLPIRVGRKKIYFAGPDAKANAEEHTPAAAE